MYRVEILRAVKEHFPGLFPFVSAMYAPCYDLWTSCGETGERVSISSKEGVRYIDDIFAEAFVRIFNSISPSIKLTHEIVSNTSERKSLPFLDVEISKGLLFLRRGLLDICLYQKLMNAYLFIPVFSNHSPRMFGSIIVSELRRFTLCCTDVLELERVRGLYATRLAARGYPSELISECFKSVFVRDELLFPSHVRRAHMCRTAMRPPFNAVMFPFDPPLVSNKKRNFGVLTFAVDNSP
jgi:hypothetical protein